MDKRDLRIDDWVNVEVNIQTHEMKPIRIKQILSRCIKTQYLKNLDPPFGILYPIELTESLIVKNKIAICEGCYGIWNIGTDITLEKHEDYWVVSVANDINVYEKKIKYLHQLQHELWDAGENINIECYESKQDRQKESLR